MWNVSFYLRIVFNHLNIVNTTFWSYVSHCNSSNILNLSYLLNSVSLHLKTHKSSSYCSLTFGVPFHSCASMKSVYTMKGDDTMFSHWQLRPSEPHPRMGFPLKSYNNAQLKIDSSRLYKKSDLGQMKGILTSLPLSSLSSLNQCCLLLYLNHFSPPSSCESEYFLT